MILDSYLKTCESIALIFAFYNRGFVINPHTSKFLNYHDLQMRFVVK